MGTMRYVSKLIGCASSNDLGRWCTIAKLLQFVWYPLEMLRVQYCGSGIVISLLRYFAQQCQRLTHGAFLSSRATFLNIKYFLKTY